MTSFLASDPGVFGLFTVVIMGGAGFMTGQAVASSWRPVWQAVAYCLLLGATNRFLVFALFGGPLMSAFGYILDTLVITAIGLVGYRLKLARQMIAQYPWLYERIGLWRWREKADG